MANRYWVGGTGTWDATAGTKWATTSGGAGGAAVPTAADDVFFDANSGAVIITTSGTTTDVCRSLDCTGFTGTLAHASSTTITIGDAGGGSLTLVSGMTYTRGSTTTSRWSFVSTTTGNTIDAGGKTLANVTFDGVGGGWTLASAFNVNASTSSTIALTNGSLNTGNQDVGVGILSSSNSNTRALTLGSSTVTVSGTSTSWNIDTSTGMTLDAGTSSITAPSSTFRGGGLTYYDVSLTANAACNLYGANTFNNLTRTSGATRSGTLVLNANQVVNETLTLTGNNALPNRLLVRGNTSTYTPYTITAGNTSITNVDIWYITAGGAPWKVGTSVADLGGNSNIGFSPVRTLYWVGNGGEWSDSSHWSLSSGGAGGIDGPTPQDNAIFDANSFSSTGQSVLDTNINRLGKNISWQGVTNSPTWQTTGNTIFGSVFLSPDMTWSGGGSLVCELQGNNTFDTSGLSYNGYLYFQGPSTASVTIASDINLTGEFSEVGVGINLTSKCDTIVAQYISIYDNARTVDLSGTDVYMLYANIGYIFSNGAQASVVGGTLNVVGSMLGVRSQFRGFGVEYPNVNLNASGTGVVGITGNNTFKQLTIQPSTVAVFDAGSAQSILSFTANGTQDRLTGIRSSIVGSVFALVQPQNNSTKIDYIALQDSSVTGGTWIAGPNSSNLGNNSGWTFGSYVFVDKPQTSAFTKVNIGRYTGYNDSDIEYSSATTYYSGNNPSQYTNIAKPSVTSYVNIAKPTS